MKDTRNTLRALALTSVVLTALSAQAGVVTTIEPAAQQVTSVSPVITETFDSQPAGPISGATAVGTLSSGGAVVPASASSGAYGGAFSTDYYAVGTQSQGTAATLTFAAPQSFFGMWWAAGDADNVLKLYNGATLLETYTTAGLLASLPAGYNGNPNNALDSGEKFAYVDFTATGGDVITKVEFDNSLNTGFEIDNLSIHATPDGGSSAAILGSAMALLAFLRGKCKQ